MRTELFIENYQLDISADISSLLTFALDSLKDFSERSTTFSKTIVLPGTANNNKLFGNIFQVGQANQYDDTLDNIGYNFNASKSVDAIIFQDQMQTFKGVLRLLQINIIKGRIEYEVAVFGQLAGLTVALSSGLIEQLDFSSYDHAYNATNIKNSWDNAGGSGYYYPLIDYGECSSDKHSWDFRTFRPALYAKEYIDKMFEVAGFRYDSDLFDSARFKSLIIPHNQKILTKPTDSILVASRSTSQHVINHTTSLNSDSAAFTSISGGLFSDVGGKVFTYLGTETISTTLTLHMDGEENFAPVSTHFTVKITIRKNGVDFYYDSLPLSDNTGFNSPWSKDWSVPITFDPADTFQVFFLLQGGPAGSADVYIDNATLNITSDIILTAPLDYGDTVEMQFTIPRNVRQMDFLLGIIKLFNLYVYEDRLDTRLIHITPYIDFYSTDSSNAVDWSYKLNRDKTVKLKPMSELNAKLYQFKYKSDADYYNDLYRKRYGQGYGDYTFDSTFEFAEAIKSFEITFSATPIVGYLGEDKIYSTIMKLSNGLEEHVDSNIRILQSKKISGVTSWDIMDEAVVKDSATAYGYAGHFDDPDAPGNDLNFGALAELFFTLASGDLTKTQFNVYWSSYMAEITDKDSKLLSGFFYLNPKDIIDLDFSTFVYLDGVLFRLSKITDYNVSNPSDCQIELLKIINLLY